MRKHAIECLIGFFLAAVVILTALSSTGSAPFIYQGF